MKRTLTLLKVVSFARAPLWIGCHDAFHCFSSGLPIPCGNVWFPASKKDRKYHQVSILQIVHKSQLLYVLEITLAFQWWLPGLDLDERWSTYYQNRSFHENEGHFPWKVSPYMEPYYFWGPSSIVSQIAFTFEFWLNQSNLL